MPRFRPRRRASGKWGGPGRRANPRGWSGVKRVDAIERHFMLFGAKMSDDSCRLGTECPTIRVVSTKMSDDLHGKMSTFCLFSYTFRLWSSFLNLFFQSHPAARHKVHKSATNLPFLCRGNESVEMNQLAGCGEPGCAFA